MSAPACCSPAIANSMDRRDSATWCARASCSGLARLSWLQDSGSSPDNSRSRSTTEPATPRSSGSEASRFLDLPKDRITRRSLTWVAEARRIGIVGDENRGLRLLAHARGLAIIDLGLGISVDELTVGLSAGLLGLSIAVTVIWIAVQAFGAAQLGLRLGAGLGEEVRERSEQAAGVA